LTHIRIWIDVDVFFTTRVEEQYYGVLLECPVDGRFDRIIRHFYSNPCKAHEGNACYSSVIDYAIKSPSYDLASDNVITGRSQAVPEVIPSDKQDQAPRCSLSSDNQIVISLPY
jgi:hypothetical protein